MFHLPFQLNDNTKPVEVCRRPVDVLATQEEVDHLVREGWLQLDGLVSEGQLEIYREALDRVVAAEVDDPRTEHVPNNGHYLRSLLDKDAAFHPMLHMHKPLSIGRATVGPQVWFDVEARVVPAGVPGMRVNWHIHHRVIPDPMPPFFSYPHAIHGLLYLDDVSEDTGCICILPRSHNNPHLSIPAGNCDPQPGEVRVPTKAGTILLMHANTWHRTVPTTVYADRRRLLLFGYTPAWIKSDVARGVKPKIRLTDELKAQGDAEIRELLGEYYW
jgi:hypothetical protein